MKSNNFREMVSNSNGILSSKRVMGVIILTVCMLCTVWLVYNEGGTQVVENLLQTLMIMAATLLGISSVTGIWKNGKIISNPKRTEEHEDPCSNCQYNKKETEL